MIGLGNDGGTANSGYSVIEFKNNDWKYLEIGLMESAFKNLTETAKRKPYTKKQKEAAKKAKKRLSQKDQPIIKQPFSEAFPVYVNALDSLFDDYKIGLFVAERFQVRNITQGPTIEMVSMMNGVLAYKCFLHQVKPRFVIASQWKNAINKFISLDDIYKTAKKLKLTPHECDSTGMLLYDAAQKGLVDLEQSLKSWKKKLNAYVSEQH